VLYADESIEKLRTSGSGGSGSHRGTGKRNRAHFLQFSREQKSENITRNLEESDLGLSYCKFLGDAGTNGFGRFTRQLYPWKLLYFGHHRRSMYP